MGVEDAEGVASAVEDISVDKVFAGRKDQVYARRGKGSRARLSSEDMPRISELMKAGASALEVQTEFGVSRSTAFRTLKD